MTRQEVISHMQKLKATNRKTSVNKQVFIDELVDVLGMTNWDAKRKVRTLLAETVFHSHTMGGNPHLYYGDYDPGENPPKISNPRDSITIRRRYWRNL